MGEHIAFGEYFSLVFIFILEFADSQKTMTKMTSQKSHLYFYFWAGQKSPAFMSKFREIQGNCLISCSSARMSTKNGYFAWVSKIKPLADFTKKIFKMLVIFVTARGL